MPSDFDPELSTDRSNLICRVNQEAKAKDNIEQLTICMAQDVKPAVEVGDEIRQHLVLATSEQALDDYIARWHAKNDSRIQDRDLEDADFRIAKGDAGEGRTYVDLLNRYDREQIVIQPKFVNDTGAKINPDFVIHDHDKPDELLEVVDSKAWSLLRPRDVMGDPVSREDFLRYLQQRPAASTLLNMRNLQDVVEKYASVPQLGLDGKVVLYFPEEVMHYSPQVKKEIESWSASALTGGHMVEVRSMGVWDEQLWKDARQRYA